MALVRDASGRAVLVQSAPYTVLRETLSLVQRQVEDLRWDSVSTDPDAILDEPYGERVDIIKQARTAAKRSPLVKVAVNLLQHYVLGQGVSVKAQNRALVAKVVDEFLENPVNRAVITSHQAQKEFLEATYTDGDFFFVLFPDDQQGTLEVSTIDATLIEDPIPDSNNAKVIKWYKVRRPSKVYDYGQGRWDAGRVDDFVYYRHYQNEDDPPTGMEGRLQKGLIMQVSVDKRGKFGRSQLASALDWIRAHREFMQDRATINRAAAAVAWKKKRKGPASDIVAEAGRMASSLSTNTGRYESNPPRTTGATVVENEGSSLEWMKTETGGSAADFDERKLRMMVGAGLGGVPNHYFGDEGNANLATATAMELPLLKMYEDWQQTVREALLELVEFALQTANKAGRIGPRDLSDRYTERDTTPQGVMDQPEAVKAPGGSPVSAREALQLPYAPAPLPGGVRMIPKPTDAKDDSAAASIEDDPSKPVSWYVDIDFPPIVQKQLDTFMSALSGLSTLLPSETIESRKLVVELALTTFGVNDIDQTMARLFPADMVAVNVPPPPPAQPGEPGGPPLPAPPPAKVREAVDEPPVESIAAFRRLRLIRAADDAAAALVG